MSQRELAELAGISFRTVQVWESTGTEKAAAGKLAKVAAILGCRVDDLLD